MLVPSLPNMIIHKRINRHPQRGFTMLEVVIAMAIGAIGIVAFVGLQLKAGDLSLESRYRATAAFIADEAIERMTSNSQDNLAKNVYQDSEGSWTADPGPRFGYFDPDYCRVTCSPQQMAEADITNLKRLARNALPNGSITHRQCGDAVGGGEPPYECIVVTWDDAVAATCGTGDTDTDDDSQGLDECYVLQMKVW